MTNRFANMLKQYSGNPQSDIEEMYRTGRGTMKARATYVRKMEELLLAGQRERQFTAIRAIEGELQVTRDVQSFVDHFEITGE